MSAYMVDRDHIRYLLCAAMQMGHGGDFHWSGRVGGVKTSKRIGRADFDKATEVGQMLWDENKASVRYRYPDCTDDDLPGMIGEDYVFVFEPWFGRIDPVQVLKSCSCYEYQSCEHPDWRSSEARDFVEEVRSLAISCLPGYEGANWGAPDMGGHLRAIGR